MFKNKIVKKEYKNFTIPYKLFHYRIDVVFVDKCSVSEYHSACVYKRNGSGKLEITKKDLSIKVIMHESIHLANMISEHIGLPINEANDEFTTYVSTDIAEKILDKINKFK